MVSVWYWQIIPDDTEKESWLLTFFSYYFQLDDIQKSFHNITNLYTQTLCHCRSTSFLWPHLLALPLSHVPLVHLTLLRFHILHSFWIFNMLRSGPFVKVVVRNLIIVHIMLEDLSSIGGWFEYARVSIEQITLLQGELFCLRNELRIEVN